jgi:hypothetical protein
MTQVMPSSRLRHPCFQAFTLSQCSRRYFAALNRSKIEMAATAKMVVERRAVERFVAGLDSTMREAERHEFDVVIEDLSATGLSMSAIAGLTCDDQITLDIPGVGARSATVVRAASGKFGCTFAQPLSDADLSRVLNPRSATVIAFPRREMAVDVLEDPEPHVIPYARWQRGLLLLGLGVTCWGLVIWAVMAIFSAL